MGGIGWWIKAKASGETAASIKNKYESNANTNAFTDAEKSQLANGNFPTLNTTSGNIATLNTTTGNIETVNATTVGANQVNADSISVSKDQNETTRIEVINPNAGTNATVAYFLNNGTYEAAILLTGTAFDDFPGYNNWFVLSSDAPGGFLIESVASDITIQPLQEADGNGFNVNITGADGFDSGATARNGGNVILTAGAGVNGGIGGIVATPNDVEITDNTKGIILKGTPNNNRYRITIDDTVPATPVLVITQL